MDEWFTSFDDAWSSFLARDEPLESFLDEFPADPAVVVEAWLIVPSPDVKRAALRVQRELEQLPGLRVVPRHYLHISLTGTNCPELEQIHELEVFEVRLPRLNCFPKAVVAEVESPALDALDAPATFLPHLSLAYVERAIDVGPVRDAVVPRRDVPMGSFVVEELLHARVPAGRSTILEPWALVERVSLRR